MTTTARLRMKISAFDVMKGDHDLMEIVHPKTSNVHCVTPKVYVETAVIPMRGSSTDATVG